MPINFLTDEQNQTYARYQDKLTPAQLDKYFYLDDKDRGLIESCRRDYNKIGYALQLTTVRFVGTFLPNPLEVPREVINYLIQQLGINLPTDIDHYLKRKATRSAHCNEIKSIFGYQDFNIKWRFRLSKWLYYQAWYGNERPRILFERCTIWLVERKVLLPGISTLTTLISKIRDRVSKRLWQRLASLVSLDQIKKLENLLVIPPGKRYSKLDELKKGPTRISGNGLVQALLRYKSIHQLGIGQINISNIPKTKIHYLARYVTTSWAPSIARMPYDRRIAVLLSFAYVYETKALDDALDLLDMLITEIMAQAKRLGEKKRIRSLGDLDKAALKLSDFGNLFLHHEKAKNLPKLIYKTIPKEAIAKAVETIKQIARSNHDRYYEELLDQYKRVRRFLPTLLRTVSFQATKAGKPLKEAMLFLKAMENKRQPSFNDAPINIVNNGWHDVVFKTQPNKIDRPGYTLCVIDNLQTNLRCRDVFVEQSERWDDPRAKLLRGIEWEKNKHPVCRSMNLCLDFDEAFNNLSAKLHNTYQAVIERLPKNEAVEIIKDNKGHDKIKLSRLEKIDESESLKTLKNKVGKLLPSIDFPQLLLEVDRMTKFTQECTHISDIGYRASGIEVSLCAILMADSCNIGLEPIINEDIPELKRDRLSWVQQNYIRAETLAKVNACLVDYHSKLPLALKIGTGDVASADGLRFVCAVKTVNSGPNRKYYGSKRGITYYNFSSDQGIGFYGIIITGTLRDSLYLLDGLQEQQTTLDPREIMTDTAGASEIIFALFWLLGYQFSPRLADIGKTRLSMAKWKCTRC
jgi:TnpA family transposase